MPADALSFGREELAPRRHGQLKHLLSLLCLGTASRGASRAAAGGSRAQPGRSPSLLTAGCFLRRTERSGKKDRAENASAGRRR